MKRTFLLKAVFLASLSLSGHSSAIGLGDASLNSWLGQPLDVLIPLTDTVGISEQDVLVRQIYGQSARKLNFEDAINSPRYIISTKTDDKGQLWVKANTRHSVTDPYISFVLQVERQGGTVNREYTLLMDMPPSDDTARNSNYTQPFKSDPLAPVFPIDNGLSAKFSRISKHTPPLSAATQAPVVSTNKSVDGNTAQVKNNAIRSVVTLEKKAIVEQKVPVAEILANVKPLLHSDDIAVEHDDTKRIMPNSAEEQSIKAANTAIQQEVTATTVLEEPAELIPAATQAQQTVTTNTDQDSTNYLYFLVAALLLLASALLAKVYWPQLYRRSEKQTPATDTTERLKTSSSENTAINSAGGIQNEHEIINLHAPVLNSENTVLVAPTEESWLNEPLLEDFDIDELNDSLLDGSDISSLDFGLDIENTVPTKSAIDDALLMDAGSDVSVNSQKPKSIDLTTDMTRESSEIYDLDSTSDDALNINTDNSHGRDKNSRQQQSLGQAAESEQNLKDKELHKKLAERKLEINNDHPTFTPSDIDSGHIMLEESYQPEELESLNASENSHNDADSDTIWQANIYAAYGQHDRAEKLLNQGLSESPDSVALKLALLDIYARSSQHDQFELLCKNIPQDEDSTRNSIAEWRKQFNIGPKSPDV